MPRIRGLRFHSGAMGLSAFMRLPWPLHSTVIVIRSELTGGVCGTCR